MSGGRHGMSASATAAYDALSAAQHPLTLAIVSLLGAAQGTAPPDRWQHCAEAIDQVRALLDQAHTYLTDTRNGIVHQLATDPARPPGVCGASEGAGSFQHRAVTCPRCLALLATRDADGGGAAPCVPDRTANNGL